jgi:Putative prokaryotic signal transducing protein
LVPENEQGLVMQRLYRAANLPDAYLLLHRLQHAGIEARVLNEHAQGGVGEIPFTHAYPEVWLVEPADAEQARSVVADFERRAPPGTTVTCRSCNEENPGGFEICWRCGAVIEE